MIPAWLLLAPWVGADVAGDVELFFRRPSPPEQAPVLIELCGSADIEATGAVLTRARDGRTLGHDRWVAARASPSALAALSSLPQVARIEADGSPFAFPHPLAGTAKEIQAPDVWAQTLEDVPLTGQGMILCDIDLGIDVFHPLFFRADGGYHAWIDEDGDGAFTPGVDSAGGSRLRVLDGHILGPYSNAPVFGSESAALDAAFDWLYADDNDNGLRDYGRAAGFDDSAPAFGEPLFVVDDVNRNSRLDRDEKLVALGTSKIRVVQTIDTAYVRGQNLIDTPAVDAAHGTASASVLVGGHPGLGRIVGIAPDAELVMMLRGETVSELYALTSMCMMEGARVVLHEYAPWQGFFLDGSSPLEDLIDTSSRAGVAHINPAGNLSTAEKLYKRTHTGGRSTAIRYVVPDDAYHVVGITVLWREPARQIALTLEDPTGFSRALPDNGSSNDPWHNGLDFIAFRSVSTRGTARVDAYVFDQEERASVIPGTWQVHVNDSSAGDFEVIAYVADDVSGWGKGVHFPEYVSEDHLVGFPGTADLGIAVAAYAHHGYFGSTPGFRAYYSGRGRRIDGAAIMSIAAPDDPVTAGWLEERPATYRIFGGTSGASPHVAGAAALLMQANPRASGVEVRAALRAGALVDDAVGEAPNDDYGYGKLRIHRAIFGTDPPSGPPVLAIAERALRPGENATIDLIANDPDDTQLIAELDRDYDGVYEEPLDGLSFAVRYESAGHRAHKVRVLDTSGREAVALARIDVVEAPGLIAGGGCSLSPRPGVHWPWLLWLFAMARRGSGTRRWCAPIPRRETSAPRSRSARARG